MVHHEKAKMWTHTLFPIEVILEVFVWVLASFVAISTVVELRQCEKNSKCANGQESALFIAWLVIFAAYCIFTVAVFMSIFASSFMMINYGFIKTFNGMRTVLFLPILVAMVLIAPACLGGFVWIHIMTDVLNIFYPENMLADPVRAAYYALLLLIFGIYPFAAVALVLIYVANSYFFHKLEHK